MTFCHLPADAVLVDFDPRQSVAVLLLDAAFPQIDRLVHVTVGGDHEVFRRVIWTGRADPALDAGRLGPVGGNLIVNGQAISRNHQRVLPAVRGNGAVLHEV